MSRLAAKYLRSVSFFTCGKVVTVLMGNPLDFNEYLHILADEIPQMATRALGRRCASASAAPPAPWGPSRGLPGGHGGPAPGDRTEDGAQFIGDLGPAFKGGSLLCRRALDTLNQHYMEADLSLVSLSAMLDVSPNHLSACIKKYAGETFMNILIRKRMEAARELLSTTPLKIQEVAQRCGYTDQHYFGYCFKKYCGESPTTLRRRLHAEKDR